MAYYYTGTRRSMSLTLRRYVNGSLAVGYPATYDGKLGNWNYLYAAITEEELARLSEEDYQARLAAFLAYVESQEPGFDADTHMSNSATDTDLSACPPPTTTTTTASVTTTTTTT